MVDVYVKSQTVPTVGCLPSHVPQNWHMQTILKRVLGMSARCNHTWQCALNDTCINVEMDDDMMNKPMLL